MEMHLLHCFFSICQYCCFCLVAKSHLTHWDPVDCSPPGSSVHGISQARALEWVAAGVSFLLQGIFPTQELNPRLLHWQADCLPPNHRRSHKSLWKVKTLVTWSCPTLCDPMDCCPPNFPVHGILWAKILEWVAIPFSSGSSQPRNRTRVSCIAGGFFTNWAIRAVYIYLNYV